MPTVDAAKIKLRRGLNLDRKKVVLDEGELGYTTDTKRVYVGDGALLGGKPVGAHNFQLQGIADITYAEPGDFTYQNNVFYSLTGTDFNSIDNWVNINPKVDGTTLEYDSSNVLSVKASGMTLSTVGAGLALDGSDVPYVNLASDAQTTALLSFNGGNEIVVGSLTNISHSNLGFQDTSTGTQHHSDADATNPGFMTASQFTKVNNSPTYPIASDADANLLIQGVNRATADKISGSRISGSFKASSSSSSDSIVRVSGQNDSSSTTLSGDNLTTPFYFLNREDFPGVITSTSLPATFVDDQGSNNNIKLTNVGGDTSVDTNYENKCFILPSGSGNYYAVFIQSAGDDTAKNAFSLAYPQYTIAACDYNSTQATLISNIIEAIRDIVNEYGERKFDIWEGSSTGDLYIHDLDKGYTPTFDATLAQGPDPATYGISTGTAADVTYEQAANCEGKNGSGYSAGDNTSGKLGISKLGWLSLTTTNKTFTTLGIGSIHTIDSFPTPAAALDGKYFLVYDADDNRYCVWYNFTGGGTAPNISNTSYRRGRKSYIIEVDISGDTTPDNLGDSTVSALQAHTAFASNYAVSYDSGTSTMTFTSSKKGYTDGIVNRINVGLGGATNFTPNITSGSPDVSKLNSAFYTSYKLDSPYAYNQPFTSVVLPAQDPSNQLKADDGNTLFTATLIKFR